MIFLSNSFERGFVMPRILKFTGFSNYTNREGVCVVVPSIRLQGKWLEKLGFDIGSKVEVSEEQGCMTIKILED